MFNRFKTTRYSNYSIVYLLIKFISNYSKVYRLKTSNCSIIIIISDIYYRIVFDIVFMNYQII